MSWWLGQLGLTEELATHILAVSRRADDDARCASALVAERRGDTAIVHRWDSEGVRMDDYPVRILRVKDEGATDLYLLRGMANDVSRRSAREALALLRAADALESAER